MVSGQRGRRPTRRDLPLFFLVYGIFFGLISVLMPLAARLDFPSESKLQQIEGTVQRPPRMKTGRGAAIVIPVASADGFHDLFETDFSHAHELLSLKPGDRVTALVTTLGGYQVWQLAHNGVTLESYEEKRRWDEAVIARTDTIAVWASAASVALLLLAFLLRKHFGAWRDRNMSQPIEAHAHVTGR